MEIRSVRGILASTVSDIRYFSFCQIKQCFCCFVHTRETRASELSVSFPPPYLHIIMKARRSKRTCD